MRIFTQGTLLVIVGGAAIVVALAGCSGSSNGAGPSSTVTVTGSSAPTDTSTPTSGTTTPPTSGSGTGSTTDPGVAGPQPRCQTKNLTASVKGQPGGSAAGTQYLEFVLVNAGGAACTLQGWPGVSFVGGGNGTQIGSAATEDHKSTHTTVALPPGSAAIVDFTQADAGNYGANCQSATADGYRIYPPGSKTSLFVAASGTVACASTSITQLTTSAVTLGENTAG